MRFLPRALGVGALLLLLLPPAAAGPTPDAAVLFRDEVVDAPLKLGWKGHKLTDETRFAVAASGLSWQPVCGGIPLLRREKKATLYADAPARAQALAGAQRPGTEKEALAFALSLLLAPPESGAAACEEAFRCWQPCGEDLDRALIGVLQAPDDLPLLPAYRYAAADALVRRASPRLLPFFLALAETSDRYLRSRAVAALGLIAYRAQPGASDSLEGLAAPLREGSVSAVQQGMIAEVVRRAAEDKHWRVRAAAALALGLMGGEESLALLEKLAKDRAYLAFPQGGKDTQRLVFPVRAQAAASLARFGRRAEDGGGVYRGKTLKQATRGGQDVTHDRRDVRPDQREGVRFCAGAW